MGSISCDLIPMQKVKVFLVIARPNIPSCMCFINVIYIKVTVGNFYSSIYLWKSVLSHVYTLLHMLVFLLNSTLIYVKFKK